MILKPMGVTKVPNGILYFHGNGGSKLEALGFAPLVLEQQISVIAFDFVGCGNSDKGYLTYGVNES
jgi:pimeloyl-ACP methyl ester carboxylesterase